MENKTAGVRMIDAEDLSWKLAELTSEDISKYEREHEHVTLVPLELVLDIIENYK